MLISFKDLAANGGAKRLSGKLDVTEALNHRVDVLGHGLLEVEVEAEAAGNVLHVHGQLAIDLKLSCSRCLNETEERLVVPYREKFIKVDDPDKHDEEEDDEEVRFVSEDKLELDSFLTEHLVLSLPFVPLCDEACLGLCPVCGVNRKEEPCGCKTEKIDPRLAGLADFFNN